MVIFALAAVAALVLCAEMERYELRQRSAQALPGALLCGLAAACAWWSVVGVLR